MATDKHKHKHKHNHKYKHKHEHNHKYKHNDEQYRSQVALVGNKFFAHDTCLWPHAYLGCGCKQNSFAAHTFEACSCTAPKNRIRRTILGFQIGIGK